MIALDIKANWIWQKDNTVPNDIVVFRKTFTTSDLPEEAIAYISVDTKYWLSINTQKVVCEGGLFRESLPGCGYADKIEIAEFLQPGENVIEVLCWYYGNQGRNNMDSGQAGLLFQCEKLDIYSDESFLCQRHPAYYTPGDPKPSYLYGGDNLGFDANVADGTFENAQIFDSATWGEVYERPIPQMKFYDAKECLDVQRNGQELTCKLPYAMQFVPLLECLAAGGEIIDIRSDRYVVNGGPGDEYNQYNSHRIEYICKPGLNQFESIEYLFGEKIVVSVSAPLEKLNISYRETAYDTEITGQFHCDCEIVNKLIQKATRTLKVCMRDNFMDCPDRERGQWIGDVSVQVPQAFFVLDQKAILLIKKAIFDFINLRDGDVLKGNVPGPCASELPSQSLNAISEWGMIAQYYKYTGDKEVLNLAFEPSIRYLQLWKLQEDGLIVTRAGDWNWFDHLYNADEKVLENAWYYSALCFAEKMASILGNHQFDDFIALRKRSMEENFERCFWKGTYYASGSFVDDRANAMAVLSGLCKKENFEKVMKILVSVFNATVYMENYVLIALCEMGYIQEAYKRMVSRYYNLAVNENSTLWEDFYILGTKNHAWSGAPITIAYRYFMGIDTTDAFETFTVNPVQNLFENMKCTFETKKGRFELTN